MSNHVAEPPKWLTSEYLEKMLVNFFEGIPLRLQNFLITPATSVGDNYAGQIFRVDLNYIRKGEIESRGVIAKVLPETGLTKEMNKSYNMFQVEVNMMSETLPMLFKELCDKGEAERFFPFVYKLDIDNKMIFMEDLKADGYVMADRLLSLDLEHTLLVVKALAKMHASSYLALKKNPGHKQKYLDCFWRKTGGAIPEKLVEGSLTYLIRSLHLWPISEEDKEIFRRFPGKLSKLLTGGFEIKENSFNVLIHGDCWTNNIMFKYQNEKVNSIKLIDYQMVHYNSIGLDFNYFLFTSAKDYVKTEHLDDIFETYYEMFISIAGEIQGFSVDTVRKEFIDRLGVGFVCAAIFRSGTLAPKAFDLDAFSENRDSPSNIEMFNNPEYISEMVKLLPIFKKHGIFKL